MTAPVLAPPPELRWRAATAVGAAVVLATSTGDAFVAAALLGATAGWWAGAAVALAVLATVARWGTADLGAVAGNQDVLGPAVTTGPALAAGSTVLAALAVLLAGGRRDPGVVLATGVGASVIACGPAATSARELGVRAAAAAVGVALAWAVTARLPGWVGVAVGTASLAAAVVA